jgi:hypothetical protein
LRKAIEDSNAGNLPVPGKDVTDSPEPSASTAAEAGDITQNTVTSMDMDSALTPCLVVENGGDNDKKDSKL